MAAIALCIDREAAMHPECIGLGGECLDQQNWLTVLSVADEARESIRHGSFDEAWVISCDDMEAINLAAAIKNDQPSLRVCLVGPQGDGSMYSRAYAAHIDAVFDQALFAHTYYAIKQTQRVDGLRVPTGARDVGLGVSSQALDSGGLLAATPHPKLEGASLDIPHTETRTVPNSARNPRRRSGALVPVVSGSGGAGKSIVSALLALVCAEAGLKTVLLDYDLQFGDERYLLGWDEALALDELIAEPENTATLPVGVGGIALLAAPHRLENAEDVVREMPRVLTDLQAHFDVVIANTGAAWAEQHAVLLERCSTGLFLIDQRSTSVRACKHALALCERCSIAATPFRFALNRVAKGAPLTSIDVSCALGGAPVLELKDGGREIEECMAAGVVPELLTEKNELCTSVRRVAEELVPGMASPADDRKARGAKQRRGGLLLRKSREDER